MMDTVIKRWYDLISIDSVDGHEINAANYVAEVLRGMGIEPHYSYFPDDKERQRPSVWCELDSGKPGKTMLLIGHIDTVEVNLKNWNTNPFKPTEIGDKVYGRGAMDMKGGLADILCTLEYFAHHKDEFSGKLVGCFVSDEEILSKGTYQLVDEDNIHADYAIMAECRYDNVAVGFRGRLSFEVIVHGRAGHTCRYPESGENAIILAGKMAEAIEALPTATHPKLEKGTWCVRYIEGGTTATLTVPDTVLLFLDRYVVPGENEESCLKQLTEAADKLGLKDKVEVRLKPRSSPYMKSFAIPEDHELVLALQDSFTEITGEKLPCAYDPSVCDSNILAVSLGIPVVTFGPSGGNMHGDNEYGYPYQVRNCLDIYIKTVKKLLG